MKKKPLNIEDIKTIWLGAVPYQIVSKTPIVTDEPKVLWGQIKQGHQLIEIDSALPHEMKRVVLLHEIIHGLLIHAGLEEHREEVPERLAYQLDTLFDKNRNLLRLWTGKR